MANRIISQRQEALKRANAVRAAGKDVKRDVREGRLDIADALFDPRIRGVTIGQLFMAQPYWGRHKTRKFLHSFGLATDKPAHTLTERQRASLATELRDLYDFRRGH